MQSYAQSRPTSPHVSACPALSKDPWCSRQRAGSALRNSSTCWGVRSWSEVLEGQTGNIESFMQHGFGKAETHREGAIHWCDAALSGDAALCDEIRSTQHCCACRWTREPDVNSSSTEYVIPAWSLQRMSSNVSGSIPFEEKEPDVISVNMKCLSRSQKRLYVSAREGLSSVQQPPLAFPTKGWLIRGSGRPNWEHWIVPMQHGFGKTETHREGAIHSRDAASPGDAALCDEASLNASLLYFHQELTHTLWDNRRSFWNGHHSTPIRCKVQVWATDSARLTDPWWISWDQTA